MSTTVLSASPESTYQLGETIGQTLRGDETIFLSGDLGAGKTLFTKGIAAALDIDASEVVSPTFTLMNRLEGKHVLYHFDLYRLGERIGGYLPEIDDYIGEGIMVIEWAQYLEPAYFGIKNALDIRFLVTDEDTRRIEILAHPAYIKIPK